MTNGTERNDLSDEAGDRCWSCGELTTEHSGTVGEDIEVDGIKDGATVAICDECGGVH